MKKIYCPVADWDCPYYDANGCCMLYPNADPIDECDEFAMCWTKGNNYIVDDEKEKEREKTIKALKETTNQEKMIEGMKLLKEGCKNILMCDLGDCPLFPYCYRDADDDSEGMEIPPWNWTIEEEGEEEE